MERTQVSGGEKSTKGIDWDFLSGEKKASSPITAFLNSTGWSASLPLAFLLSVIAIAIPLYCLYLGIYGSGEVIITRSIAITLALSWIILYRPLTGGHWASRTAIVLLVDAILFAAIIYVQIYLFLNLNRYAEGIFDVSTSDLVAGTIFVVLILEATRRSFGVVLTLLAMFFIVHPLYGGYFPGFFNVRATTVSNLVEQLFISNNGIYGLAIGVFLTYIVVFMFFSSMVQVTKAGAFFNSLASALIGSRSGGPAKIAVLSSGFLATISGAAIANVATTGTITIPLMKKSGLSARFAAAVEAVASTGGQIMPPIMGVTAFVMASIIGISYNKVCLSALFPACLYYISLFFIIHFAAKRDGLRGIDQDQLPDLGLVLKQGFHLLSPFLVLSYMLIAGYTALNACLWAIYTMFIVSFIGRKTRITPMGLLEVFENCTRSSAPIGIACATIGIILGSLGTSGLGFKFSTFVISQAHGHLLPSLIVCMVASIILGMGMPPLLVYISLALMVIPALTSLGVDVIAAHMFVFFYAVLSGITPPVALVAYTAAGIAGTNPFKTGVAAFQIGLPVLIIPFMFVYSPELLLNGKPFMVALAIITATIGVICFAAAISGCLLTRTNAIERCCLVAASLLAIKPGLYTDVAGLVLIGSIVVLQLRRIASAAPIACEVASER